MVDKTFGALAEERLHEAHGPRKQGEDLPVRLTLAYGENGRLSLLNAIGDIGPVEVALLQGGGGRKDDIRILGGVGHESLVDDGE